MIRPQQVQTRKVRTDSCWPSSLCIRLHHIKAATHTAWGVLVSSFGVCHQSHSNSSSTKMRSMTTLNLAVTWEPKRGEPVQVSGLGILPAVSLDFSNDSMKVSDCCDLTRCCEGSGAGRCCRLSGSATDAGAVSMRKERKEGSKSTGKVHSDTTYQKKGA
ncbi:hypothetical protein AC578_242 [Pseudocercospora eumusae]|uniref:Uncharacterized protein n=1 Tax=Pseudocercospora eumusae TaxID=321146 RepID=A0A139HIH0_9PEZI|nr:hypothetical protein AC578_242 [Pseudocercospora eumusae]